MAQDFEGNGGQITNSETTLRAAADSDDAIIGLRLANILTTNITVSVWIDEGNSADRYLIKDVSIPRRNLETKGKFLLSKNWDDF